MALVGRDVEAATVRAFVGGVSGGPSLLMVEGDAGIGKTTLFDAAVAAVSDHRVLLARCVEPDAGLAYAGLADLFGPWTDAALAQLPTPLAQALNTAMLRAGPGDRSAEPHAVGRATLAALQLLTAAAPVLVMIDDVQWLDPATARALGFALRRLDGEPIGVLVTRRGTEQSLPFGLDDWLPPVRRQRLRLGPVPASDMQVLLDEHYGGLPRPLLARILATAAGNPLFALELAAAQAAADEITPDQLTVPVRLRQLVAERLGRLTAEAAEPVAAVASLSAPTVATVVAALGERARASLDEALDARVLRVREGRLRFVHPLYGVAALAAVPPSTLRSLQAKLAVHASDPEERARHLVAAADGPDATVAAAVEAGADRARARGAPEVAAMLAEAAVGLTPPGDHGDRGRRQIAAGYHWVTAGDIRRGGAVMATALAGMAAGPARTDLRWRVAMLTHLNGQTSRGVELLEAAWCEAGDDPALRASVATKLAALYRWQGRTAESLHYGRIGIRQAELTADPRRLLDALQIYSFTAFLAGAEPNSAQLDRIDSLARVVRPLAVHDHPDALLGIIDLARGDATSASMRMDRLWRLAEESGEEFGFVGCLALRAELDLRAGRWLDAQHHAELAMAHTRRLRFDEEFSPALPISALVEAHLGNVEVARAAATTLVEYGTSRGLPPLAVHGRAVLGFLALSRGDARGTHRQLGPLLDQLREMGVLEPTVAYLAWSDLESLVDLGELDRAAALAADLRSRGAALDRPWADATAARGEGLVLAARGDFAGAQIELERSLAAHDRLGWPFERARTLLALGIVLRRGKQKRNARDTLQQAFDIFDALGSPQWAAKATAELSRIGGRQTSPPGSLTGTERRVAELVAAGHTNREVADRLFLSTKTVAAHLTAVYAKLGLRSRTELSRSLHDRPGSTPSAP